MIGSDLDLAVAIPNAGYEWVVTPHRGEPYLRESPAEGAADSGYRVCRPDAEFPALFLEAAYLDPDDLDSLRDFANKYGPLRANDDPTGRIGPINGHPELAWMARASARATWRGAIGRLRRAVEAYSALVAGADGPTLPAVRWEGRSAWFVCSGQSITERDQAWIEYDVVHEADRFDRFKLRMADGLSLSSPAERAKSRIKPPVPPPVAPAGGTEEHHWDCVIRPGFSPDSSPRLVVEAWLDDTLSTHLNGRGIFEVRFERHPRTTERRVTLVPKHLHALVWAQFARAVINKQDFTNDFRRCKDDGCKKWFCLPPKERARRVFCSDACKVRHFRTRKSSAETMSLAGRSALQIAKELGTDVSTVKKWLKATKKPKGD